MPLFPYGFDWGYADSFLLRHKRFKTLATGASCSGSWIQMLNFGLWICCSTIVLQNLLKILLQTKNVICSISRKKPNPNFISDLRLTRGTLPTDTAAQVFSSPEQVKRCHGEKTRPQIVTMLIPGKGSYYIFFSETAPTFSSEKKRGILIDFTQARVLVFVVV